MICFVILMSSAIIIIGWSLPYSVVEEYLWVILEPPLVCIDVPASRGRLTLGKINEISIVIFCFEDHALPCDLFLPSSPRVHSEKQWHNTRISGPHGDDLPGPAWRYVFFIKSRVPQANAIRTQLLLQKIPECNNIGCNLLSIFRRRLIPDNVLQSGYIL